MANKGLRELFGELLSNAELREDFANNSQDAIKGRGYELDSNEMQMVTKIVEAEGLENMSIEELEERVALCGGGGGGGGGASAGTDSGFLCW